MKIREERFIIILLLLINIFLINKAYTKYKEAFAPFPKSLPIYSVNRDDKKVSLTFDVNWGDNHIEEILNTLDIYNVKATFFIIGKWGEDNKDIVKKIYSKGHEIGNHSYSHKLFSNISSQEIKKEIDKCDLVLENITGEKPKLFRFPSGDYNSKAVDIIYNTLHVPVQWSVDSIDWMEQGRDIEYSRVVNKCKSGDIILFHTNSKYTPENIGRILENFKTRGIEVLPLSKLLYKNSRNTDNFGKQSK